MITKLHDSHTGFDIPKHTSHVTRAGDNLPIANEATATEITGVSAQLAPASDAVRFSTVEVIDGTDVVETAACNEVSGRRISASHNPAGAKRNGMDFVGGVGVPYDKLSVL